MNRKIVAYERLNKYLTYQLLTKEEKVKENKLQIFYKLLFFYLVKLLSQYLEPIVFFVLRTDMDAK